MSDRILRLPELKIRIGIGRSTLYEWIGRGTFPAPVQLGERAVGWRESEVIAWLDGRKPRQVVPATLSGRAAA